MPDAEDDEYSLRPTTLDMVKLEELSVHKTMHSENGAWSVVRYEDRPEKGKWWQPFVLLLAHPMRGYGFREFKNILEIVEYLKQLEDERRKP